MGGTLEEEEAIDFEIVNKILSSNALDFHPATSKSVD
jgi:hypothetical protein